MEDSDFLRKIRYPFRYTATPPYSSPEQIAEIGNYNEFFSLSNALVVEKKSWVPMWLWKLVANVKFVGEE